MGVYDIDEEERITAKAIETGISSLAFEQKLNQNSDEAFDPLALLMGGNESDNKPPAAENRLSSMPTLYNDDFSYLKEAIEHLRQAETLTGRF